MQKVAPCLWFDDDAEEAARAYGEMMAAEDAKRAEAVMNAVLQMKKIDLDRLRQVYGKR